MTYSDMVQLLNELFEKRMQIVELERKIVTGMSQPRAPSAKSEPPKSRGRPPVNRQSSVVPYKRFITLLQEKYPYEPKQGMKRALLDWNRKERAEGRTELKINEGIEQLWRRKGEVPIWAMTYLKLIERLPRRPVSKDWNPTEVGFLKRLIKTRPELSYIEMGEICSKKFHREIGENSIKGMSDRLGFGKSQA